MMIRIAPLFFWLSLGLIMAGCQTTTDADSTTAKTRPAPSSGRPVTVPAGPTRPGVTTVPVELMQKVKADLSKRTGAAPEALKVLRAESARFSDGSLGCPEPGTMYTQALVDGYWVVLEHESKSYDYRLSGRGSFKLCPNGKPPVSRDATL